jgi:hypothetical protein
MRKHSLEKRSLDTLTWQLRDWSRRKTIKMDLLYFGLMGRCVNIIKTIIFHLPKNLLSQKQIVYRNTKIPKYIIQLARLNRDHLVKRLSSREFNLTTEPIQTKNYFENIFITIVGSVWINAIHCHNLTQCTCSFFLHVKNYAQHSHNKWKQ